MRRATVLVICLMVLGVGLAWAQEGTPNLSSAVPWQAEKSQVTGEVRLFEGSGNATVAISLRGAVEEGMDAELCYFTMDTEGEGAINNAVRRSEMDLVVVNLKWAVSGGSPKVAVQPGLEMPRSAPTGTNAATGGFAAQRAVIPTLSVPMEWGDPAGLLLILQPKAAWFKSNIPDSTGGITEGFGHVLALGVGVVYNAGAFRLIGDATTVLSGDNSIDEATNNVTDDLVWSAGASVDAGGRYDLTISVFATNAFGPTPATSLLATPDQSIGTGVCVSGEF